MSVRVMALVWDNFPRGGSELLTMLALADWCNDVGGSLHPSIAAVARKVRLSEKQARRIVHAFIRDGYLSVVGNAFGGKPVDTRHYRLNVRKLAGPGADATLPAGVSPPLDGAPPKSMPDPSQGTPLSPPVGGSLTVSEPPIYPPEREEGGFDVAMALYPERAGDNSRANARRAWDTRIRKGSTARDMIEGVIRYAAFVRATGKEGSQFVKQAATFFGPAKYFLEPYAIPVARAEFDPLAYVNRSGGAAGFAFDAEADGECLER